MVVNERKLESWSMDVGKDEKKITLHLSRDVKGTGFRHGSRCCQSEDDKWFYLPARRKHDVSAAPLLRRLFMERTLHMMTWAAAM